MVLAIMAEFANICVEGADEAVWECRLSGQSKITFEEAQKSEEKHRQILAVSNLKIAEIQDRFYKCYRG